MLGFEPKITVGIQGYFMIAFFIGQTLFFGEKVR